MMLASRGDMSAIREDGPKRIAEFTHADDTIFTKSFVNMWRAGKLKYVEDDDAS